MQYSHKIKFNCGVFVLIALSFPLFVVAQPLKIVKKSKTYWQEVQADSLQMMIEVKHFLPDVVYDLRYATPNNFTGRQLYPSDSKAFLRTNVGKALQEVQASLRTKGLGLKIFDAYRPYSATKKMWDLIHDERYVANPAKGSGHNRGLAVDLTIIDISTGKELNMGTGFDNFTDSAHHDFKNMPGAILANRSLLRTTMEAHGFTALETEWWHYSWKNDRNYEVLDLPFKKLAKRD
jgi:D-alanyl-D-alanine dipeptidase